MRMCCMWYERVSINYANATSIHEVRGRLFLLLGVVYSTYIAISPVSDIDQSRPANKGWYITAILL